MAVRAARSSAPATGDPRSEWAVGAPTPAHHGRLAALADLLGRDDGPCTVLGLCTGGDAPLARLLSGRAEVTATFVEDDAMVAVAASQTLRAQGLRGVEVVHSDPGVSDTYAGRVPADLVLFGPQVVDVPTMRRQGLVEALPALVSAGGHVCWWSDRDTDLSSWTRALAAVGTDPQVRIEGQAWGLARFVARPRTLIAGTRFYPAR